MAMLFVSKETSRIDCALDGVVIKRIAGTNDVSSTGGTLTLAPGQSAAFVNGRLIPLPSQQQAETPERLYPWWNPLNPPSFLNPAPPDEWDQWVAERWAKRDALIAQGLHQSGMTEPIPGLAGMVEGGKFFDCPQYGKCWRENEAVSASERQKPPTPAAAPQANPVPQTTSGTKPGPIVINKAMLSRCPMQVWKYTARGRQQISTVPVQYGPCFAGSWDYATWDSCRRPPGPWDMAGTYWTWTPCPTYTTWVVGRRHRHSCHFHNTHHHGVGIVPRHPLDRTGRPPVNAKAGLLTLTLNKGHVQPGLAPAPVKAVQWTSQLPRGMDHPLAQSAPRVAQPVLQARLAESIMPRGILVSAGRAEPARNLSAIRFDFKSQSFVGSARTATGVSHAVVVNHVSGGGASFGGGNGSHSGSSGGGGSHASSSSSSGSSSGGGGHSSGGSSGGGSAGGGGGHH